MTELQPEQPKPELIATKREHRLGAIAHASALLIGVPIFYFIPALQSLAFAICPVISYMISRSFRRRQLAWGAFQALQAAAVQLLLLILIFVFQLNQGTPRFADIVFMFIILVFIYTLWGAWDTLFGMNFRYLIIGPRLERVAHINLARFEPRRSWFGRDKNSSGQNRDRNNPGQ
jgi:hypothetical protein